MRLAHPVAVAFPVLALALAGCFRKTPLEDRVVTTDVVGSVEFTMERCRRTDDTLACELNVTNRGEDARIVFTDRDVVAYSDGAQLRPTGMRFAGQQLVAFNQAIPKGAPLSLDVTFAGATRAMKTVRLLEVRASVLDRLGNPLAGNITARPAQLRNIRVR
jgi:hypothetical protein